MTSHTSNQQSPIDGSSHRTPRFGISNPFTASANPRNETGQQPRQSFLQSPMIQNLSSGFRNRQPPTQNSPRGENIENQPGPVPFSTFEREMENDDLDESLRNDIALEAAEQEAQERIDTNVIRGGKGGKGSVNNRGTLNGYQKPIIGTNSDILRSFNAAFGDRKWKNDGSDKNLSFRIFDERFGEALSGVDPRLESIRNGELVAPIGNDFEANEFIRLSGLITTLTYKAIPDGEMMQTKRVAGRDASACWKSLRYWHNRMGVKDLKKLKDKINKPRQATGSNDVIKQMDEILDAVDQLSKNGKWLMKMM